MQTIVKAPAPQDFLALVPQLAGFQPHNSLVIVAFRGNRTCGAIRFDLPDTTSAKVHKRMALTMMGLICKIHGVDAVVPVVYSDESVADGRIPQDSFARAVITRARLSGFLVRDALCQAADGWSSYLDPARLAHSLDEVDRSSVHDAIPAADRREVADVAAGALLPAVDFATRERVGRELLSLQQLCEDTECVDELPVLLSDIPLLFEAALHWDAATVSPADAALLLYCLQGPPARDAMMLQFAFGLDIGAAVLTENLRFVDDGTISDTLEDGARRLWGEGPRPDPERVDRAILLLKQLATRAPRAARPAPLVMLAWLNWALGLGSAASILVARALEIDPEYGMAALLRHLFASGQLPEWAFAVPD
ncbi:DUF4192 family protein [Salinibacterium sp. ZJ450]|uniref:DUF4192 family protein n=1 Tax=Salinibacterium sp. ZJ450 TaxID=2708338 RepID=UPI001421EEAE|nr:DUF4192 family protein [Salinibacterium sp. ZJ450]